VTGVDGLLERNGGPVALTPGVVEAAHLEQRLGRDVPVGRACCLLVERKRGVVGPVQAVQQLGQVDHGVLVTAVYCVLVGAPGRLGVVPLQEIGQPDQGVQIPAISLRTIEDDDHGRCRGFPGRVPVENLARLVFQISFIRRPTEEDQLQQLPSESLPAPRCS
jgi:hypothetical protein